jgi:Na+/H+ antiporter NhaD/arsenite permease-like protein
MAFLLDPFKDKKSQEVLRLFAQIVFSFLVFFLGVGLLIYGLHTENELAISLGAGFVGTGVGTWVSP